MKRLILVFALMAVAACTSESNLPNPTGKGTIRAINAMAGSPAVGFRIEERLIGSAAFQNVTGATRWDDFSFIFNFEASFLGELTVRRIASHTQKIDDGRDYTLVLTGDVATPVVSVWEGNEREWNGDETIFEVRFANVAEQASVLGPIDVYFAPDGTAPVDGEQIATLDFGEIMPPIDIEAIEYVLTITRAGDPLDILFQSVPALFVPQVKVTIPIFDENEQGTASLSVLAINSLGGTARLVDATADPTIRFIQASIDLAISDVYDDEMLTNLILSDHAFGDITDDMPIALGQTSHFYTPAGDTSAVLLESGLVTTFNTHSNWVVIGTAGNRFVHSFLPNRGSISIYATIQIYQGAFSNSRVDIYIVDAGVPIDDENTALFNLAFSVPSPALAYSAGSYDVYVTLPNEKTILGGPFPIDVVDGDVVELMIFDTVDPAVVDIRVIPTQ